MPSSLSYLWENKVGDMLGSSIPALGVGSRAYIYSTDDDGLLLAFFLVFDINAKLSHLDSALFS